MKVVWTINKPKVLKRSNSNFCCTWCKEEKINFLKNNLSDCNSKKRCLNDFESLKRLDGAYDENEGYQNAPIFDFIRFEDVVFDTLHMLLRITGKLLKLLIRELIYLDDGNTSSLEKMPNQNKLFNFFSKIGITMPYKITKNDDSSVAIELRTFNGNECLLILEKIDFQSLFPSDEN